MSKKEQKAEHQEVTSLPKVIETTHYALSMIQNDNDSFSVIKIGFNLKESFVSPTIQVIETNTDKYIIQERLSVLLYEMELA